jgi:UPF0755 protein
MKGRIFIGGGVFLFLVLLGYFFYLLQPVSDAAEPKGKIFTVSPGTGLKEITAHLYSLGLIRSENAFKIYALISGKAGQLKPGRYDLNVNLAVPLIVKVLTAGPQEISVTIVPGATLREIDDKLTALGIIRKGALTNFDFKPLEEKYNFLDKALSLEGFLLPDTYYFLPESEIEVVIQKILDNFKQKALVLISPENPQSELTNNSDLLELLNLASLLEKEIPFNEEQRLAAGILEKRLKVGMPLQVDATIVYVKCSGRFLNCPPLQEEDYKIKSAYNTYLYPDLPPTPISNPGLDAIKAALSPIKSDYWYYLSDPETKRTIFSKTIDEHNQNRVKYLLNK